MPYVATSSTTYASLFDFKDKEHLVNSKPTAILPKYVYKELTSAQKAKLSEMVDIKTANGKLTSYLSDLYDADYYIKLGPKKKFGNETIEAVASGCLFLSPKIGFANRIFNVDTTVINSLDIDLQIDEALRLVSMHESNKTISVGQKSTDSNS